MIGKTISHYRILEKIGQGGMGIVYKAQDTTLNRTVALKFLPPHLAGSTPELARFIHEARAAAALSHPNICTVYEIDEKAEQPFIAMEYIAGRSLEEVMEAGPLALDAAVRYATQVARGLEEAHAKGVVHRDIKGANIIVSEKGHAIVTDFGLAKLQGRTRLTNAGTTVGTALYMSPEQARGEEVDHRSDIWSLGVVLYRMITGRHPFEGSHQSAVMYAIMNTPHTPVTALRTGVPMELERVIDKALAKDPTRRYQSASDLVVDLKTVRDQLTGVKTPGSGVRTAPSRSSRRTWMIAAAAVVVVAGGVFAWNLLGPKSGAPTADRLVPKDERVSIAVLPLDNMSRDASQEYIADGMTEALIAELAQIRGLRVISRTSVMRFKGTTEPIPKIAETLGVNNVIEGSIVEAGNRVRVTAQLIDAQTDEHRWAQSYERDASDILALQRDVARAIAGQVKVELTPREAKHLASASSVDPRAYDLYLRGRYHWNHRTETDLKRALDLFQQAIAIEPDWAQAHAALAQTTVVMVDWGFMAPAEGYRRTREAARKALDLDAGLGSAWATLGGVETGWEWNWAQAEEDYLKAIDLEPGDATVHQWYAEFLTSQGRFDEALAQINMAEQIDPLSLIVQLMKGGVYMARGDFDRAIALAKHVLDVDPSFTGAYSGLSDAYRFSGRNDLAADAYARYYESLVPGAARTIQAAYAKGGMDAVVHVVIHGMEQSASPTYVPAAAVGFAFASLGEADSAIVWLDRAYERRAYPLETMAVDWNCRPIRDDPRFVELLKRMKLDHVKPGYAKK